MTATPNSKTNWTPQPESLVSLRDKFAGKPETMTRKQACEILGCNYRTIIKLIDNGTLTCVPGGNPVYTEDLRKLAFRGQIQYSDGRWDCVAEPVRVEVIQDFFFPATIPVKGIVSMRKGDTVASVYGDWYVEQKDGGSPVIQKLGTDNANSALEAHINKHE